MDLSNYSLEDLILSAMKSEVDSREVYLKLAENVKNAFLKDRLNFLAKEEDKHRTFLEGVFKENLPDKEIVLPEKTPVPLPEIKIPDETLPISEILESAMEAEKKASEFYNALSAYFDNPKTKMTLIYFATMEMGHYRLLEIELENVKRFEDFDQYWPMMHIGP